MRTFIVQKDEYQEKYFCFELDKNNPNYFSRENPYINNRTKNLAKVSEFFSRSEFFFFERRRIIQILKSIVGNKVKIFNENEAKKYIALKEKKKRK